MRRGRFMGLVATPLAMLALAVMGVRTCSMWCFVACMVLCMLWWFLLEGDIADYEQDAKRWLENQKKRKQDTDDQGWLGE